MPQLLPVVRQVTKDRYITPSIDLRRRTRSGAFRILEANNHKGAKLLRLNGSESDVKFETQGFRVMDEQPTKHDDVTVDFKSGPISIPIRITKEEAVSSLKEAIHDSKEAGDHRTQRIAEKQLRELEGRDRPNQSFRNRSVTQRQLDRGR